MLANKIKLEWLKWNEWCGILNEDLSAISIFPYVKYNKAKNEENKIETNSLSCRFYFEPFYSIMQLVNANGTVHKHIDHRAEMGYGLYGCVIYIKLPLSVSLISSHSFALYPSSPQMPVHLFPFQRFECTHPHHKTNEFIALQNDLKWLPHTLCAIRYTYHWWW